MIIVYLSQKKRKKCEMIAIKSVYICKTSISFFAKWCQNAIQASVQNCSFIAEHTHTHPVWCTDTHKCINVDKKHQLNFYTNFFLIFETIPMFLRAHESTLAAHTLPSIDMCGCACLFFVSPSCALLWLEMRKSVFVHIKYSCIILNPLAIFSIWFPI